MLGISYYSYNQWRVAAKHPPHLAAIIPWEGRNDYYRDSLYHGGILSQFQERWAKTQVAHVQYGRGERAKKNPNTGESIAGPVTLSEEELAKNRVNVYEEIKKHPLLDEWHRARSVDLSQVDGPAVDLRQLGRAGHPSARQLQRLYVCGVEAEVAGGARRFPLVAFLGRVWTGTAEALFRLLPEGYRQRLGNANSRACSSTSAIPARSSCLRARKRVAAGAHPVDKVLS